MITLSTKAPLVLAIVLSLTACAKSVSGGLGGASGDRSSTVPGPPPSPAPSSLEEAASQAARASESKVEYVLDTATRKGRLVYASRAEKTSWRLEQQLLQPRDGGAEGSQAVNAWVLETPTETVFCLLEKAWRCLAGESAPDSAPALFDRRSFEFVSGIAPSIPPDSFKRVQASYAGYAASCFDIVPQSQLFVGGGSEEGTGEGPVPPLAPTSGIDATTLEALRNSLIVEVLYRGGSLCFGSGILLRLAILDEELFTITAERVSNPSDSDFVPPAPPEVVGTPSPFPSVIRAT